MPGPAPAKVQHQSVRLSKALERDVSPVWNEEDQTWELAFEEEAVCGDLIHELLTHESKKCYHDCTTPHLMRVVMRYRLGGYRQGIRTWRLKARVRIDDVFDCPLDASKIISLLAKPTNPQGDGKATGEAAGSNKQTMNVKKTTVIRV